MALGISAAPTSNIAALSRRQGSSTDSTVAGANTIVGTTFAGAQNVGSNSLSETGDLASAPLTTG
ncbi:hypothetical protein LTS08_003400 [Lithohypha guttulata]|uniref:Uncharacterized protein n=1 Tax=Lithohypha guttulata TaxID=1690604 RepID=A0AAN7SYL5_9EURO|nr:hypothetical protein LTR51_008774 [Lithohypha guttulata]KAK5085147.1 hypothetical protein LTR05_004426 [Lithohypha guttulata]KAK5103976.1 hypothetical protein LTS08_003400 [Lithohypha guttulata]